VTKELMGVTDVRIEDEDDDEYEDENDWASAIGYCEAL